MVCRALPPENSLPACADFEAAGFLGKYPEGNGVLEGGRNLTAGIRAGSYNHEFINLCDARSNVKAAAVPFRGLAILNRITSWDADDRTQGRETESGDGLPLESLAICVCHVG
jgi:hypothetical protein